MVSLGPQHLLVWLHCPWHVIPAASGVAEEKETMHNASTQYTSHLDRYNLLKFEGPFSQSHSLSTALVVAVQGTLGHSPSRKSTALACKYNQSQCQSTLAPTASPSACSFCYMVPFGPGPRLHTVHNASLQHVDCAASCGACNSRMQHTAVIHVTYLKLDSAMF